MRPRLLDLFCGAGGCSVGYHRAGFDVVGVDLHPQPNYPYRFVQDDALAILRRLIAGSPVAFFIDRRPIMFGLEDFDAIHASPPCQAYSVLRRANPGAEYPDLIEPTRAMLEATGLPYVMENVVGAPLRTTIMLCGSMFGLGAGDRQLRRHRLFESNVLVMQPACAHRGEAIGVYGGGPMGRYTFGNRAAVDPSARRGGYQGTVAEKREAMDIDWMSAKELNQAIPPAYTEYIGNQLMTHVRVAA